MELQDICWLAGLLEGEGCFSLRKHSGRPRSIGSPSIQLQMTDLDIVERAAKLLGRPVRSRNRHDSLKDVYIVELCGKDAIPVMKMLLPFMGKRRSGKINEIIAADKLRPGAPRGELHGRAKLTNDQAKAIREMRAVNPKKWTQSKLAAEFKTTQSVICAIVNGKTYVSQTALTRK